MSSYTRYYNSKQITYRMLATKWNKWASTTTLTNIELEGTKKFFYSIAKRFGLIKEFRELGVI